MTRDQIIEIHGLINPQRETTYRDAAAYIIELTGEKPDKIGVDKAKNVILPALFFAFLNADQYIEAALLGWGNVKFNPEPKESQKVFTSLHKFSKNLIIGGGGVSKSWSMTMHALLDWVRDPEFTNSKIVAPTERHAASNIWSSLLDLHRTCIIDLPGKPMSEFIVLRANDKQAAMGIVPIPSGDDGKGRLQGFHPLPRPIIHPRFGRSSRVKAYLDEAEKIPIGVWDGIDNLLTSETAEGSVSVAATWNPADVSSIAAQRAEPEHGWQSIDIDKDFEWISRMGYHVIRLDPKYTENVIQQKPIYSGFQTYEGFMNLVRQGKNSPIYFTMGRGAYPQENVEYNIIPPVFLKEAKQVYHFVEAPINVASLDPAFAEGGDEAIITSGRYGLSDGFLEGSNFISFYPKQVLQIEQQFHLPKNLTPVMCDNLIDMLRQLHVRPEYFAIDKSGSGWGLHDLLKVKFGDILGIQWGAKASENKILTEDTATAEEQYRDITTEMWFAFSKWLEFGYLKFMPIMDTHALFTQLTNRKYSPSGILPKVESKDDYKYRTKMKSPDRADSAIMLAHLCRIRQAERPAMINPTPPPQKKKGDWAWFDEQNVAAEEVDTIDYLKLD